jgi:hypothetical protein
MIVGKMNLKVRGLLQALYRHLLGVTDKNYENCQDNQTGL